MALGYDIGMRAMMTVGAGMRETHNLVGTMGATAAAGCAAGLNAQQMRWLLDYAAQQAGAGIGAWRRDTEHIEKAFVFGAMGARNGVNAALVVHSGWTGVNDVLSGPNNFVESYNSKADPAGMIEKLGERYGVVQTTIKKWTTGGPIQAPLDALENLRKRQPFAADQVKRVVVRAATSAAYTVNNRDMPDICLQHLVAVMLVDKAVSFRAAHDKARMQDGAILRERAKVELVPDEELEKLIPVRVAIVEVTERWDAPHRARGTCARNSRESDDSRRSGREGARADGPRSRRGNLVELDRARACTRYREGRPTVKTVVATGLKRGKSDGSY